MNWIRKVAIAAVMVCAMAGLAQQTTMPSVDDHLKLLSAKLELSADQQAQIRPIIQEMQDHASKVLGDKSLSQDARHEKLKAIHMKADQDARQYLTTDQQQKLDDLEKERSEMHGNAH